MSEKTRIALFGGSFNPPHLGHVESVATVLKYTDVDQVWVAPTFQHAFGKSLAPFEHRLAMAQIAMAGLGSKVVISPLEKELGGESRTIQLVYKMLSEDPSREISIVIGTDLLDEIPRWKDSEKLLSLAKLIVLQRPGHEREDPRIIGPKAVGPESASSTEVRERLEKGENCQEIVPGEVLAYIQEHGLYGLPNTEEIYEEIEEALYKDRPDAYNICIEFVDGGWAISVEELTCHIGCCSDTFEFEVSRTSDGVLEFSGT